MKVDQDISNTLMVTNLFAMILIVSVHYNTKILFSIDTFNYVCQEFFTNGIARVAVPIFSIIAGFFLASKVRTLNDYVQVLKTRTQTLLIPYFISSIIILILSFLINFHTIKDMDITFSFLLHSIHAPSIQFWFLRDLIILIIISPLLFNFHKILFNVICCALSIIWLFDIQVFPRIMGWYLLNIETLFFFALGGYFSQNINFLDKLIQSKFFVKASILLLWFGLIAIRIYLDPVLDLWYVKKYTLESLFLYKIAILIGIVSLMQIAETFRNNNILIYLSGLTFFVYLFHMQPLYSFTSITQKYIDKQYLFSVDFLIALSFTFLVAHITSKYFKKFYDTITGGRNPTKSLNRISRTKLKY